MTYLIAAIVLTLSVLKGHSPIARLFKWDTSYLWHVCIPSAPAELLVEVKILTLQ